MFGSGEELQERFVAVRGATTIMNAEFPLAEKNRRMHATLTLDFELLGNLEVFSTI